MERFKNDHFAGDRMSHAIRNKPRQMQPDMPPLKERTLKALHAHYWRRAFWYGSK